MRVIKDVIASWLGLPLRGLRDTPLRGSSTTSLPRNDMNKIQTKLKI
jgi:hypothetical protein